MGVVAGGLAFEPATWGRLGLGETRGGLVGGDDPVGELVLQGGGNDDGLGVAVSPEHDRVGGQPSIRHRVAILYSWSGAVAACSTSRKLRCLTGTNSYGN